MYRITRNETKNETDLKLRISKETPDNVVGALPTT